MVTMVVTLVVTSVRKQVKFVLNFVIILKYLSCCHFKFKVSNH